jgi:predicted acylesterase/phospholipase RssA
MARPSSPVEFALSSGGQLGAIQLGMLRALYERGIEPHLIVATSVGAINGGFTAMPALALEAGSQAWIAPLSSHGRGRMSSGPFRLSSGPQ